MEFSGEDISCWIYDHHHVGLCSARSGAQRYFGFRCISCGFRTRGWNGWFPTTPFRRAARLHREVAVAFFIPIYFGMVGYKLVLGAGLSVSMLGIFLLGSTVMCLVSVGLAARLAGFRGLDIINLAVVTNARGGPGIVLATVAYESGIINAVFLYDSRSHRRAHFPGSRRLAAICPKKRLASSLDESDGNLGINKRNRASSTAGFVN